MARDHLFVGPARPHRRDQTLGYERESWWSDKPMVRIFRRVAPNRRPGDRPRLRGHAQLRAPVYTLFADWNPVNRRSRMKKMLKCTATAPTSSCS